jgi:hypothetical protein
MLKKSILAFCTAFLLTLNLHSAESLKMDSKTLIAKNIEAMGGKGRISAMDNMKVVFDAQSPQLMGEITIWVKDGENYRMDVSQGKEFPVNSLIVTPTIGMGNNPQGGIDTLRPEALSAYRGQFINQTSIFKSPLYGYDPQNTIADYVGMENRDGKKYHVVEVAPVEMAAQKSKIYIGEKDYFVNYIVTQAQGGEIVVELTDYKNSDGISYPGNITSKYNGQVQNSFKLKELQVKPTYPKGLFQSIN